LNEAGPGRRSGGVGEVEIALGVVSRKGRLVERGVEGGAAIAGESLDGAVVSDAAEDIGGLIAEYEIAGGVECDAAELGEEDVLGWDTGADLAAGEGIDHYLGKEGRGDEGDGI
jgi:hypothetical protein